MRTERLNEWLHMQMQPIANEDRSSLHGLQIRQWLPWGWLGSSVEALLKGELVLFYYNELLLFILLLKYVNIIGPRIEKKEREISEEVPQHVQRAIVSKLLSCNHDTMDFHLRQVNSVFPNGAREKREGAKHARTEVLRFFANDAYVTSVEETKTFWNVYKSLPLLHFIFPYQINN